MQLDDKLQNCTWPNYYHHFDGTVFLRSNTNSNTQNSYQHKSGRLDKRTELNGLGVKIVGHHNNKKKQSKHE